MKILLTKKGDQIILCDKDYDLLKFQTFYIGKRGYATTCKKIKGTRKSKTTYLHHLLIKRPNEMIIDHINRNKLDNRRCNLRIVTPYQNSLNAYRKCGKDSKYIGVRKNGNSWTCRISHQFKEIYLGSFSSEDTAARAYDKKCLELRGKFAILNFP